MDEKQKMYERWAGRFLKALLVLLLFWMVVWLVVVNAMFLKAGPDVMTILGVIQLNGGITLIVLFIAMVVCDINTGGWRGYGDF